jgi:hypothetical protein
MAMPDPALSIRTGQGTESLVARRHFVPTRGAETPGLRERGMPSLPPPGLQITGRALIVA